MGSGSQACPSIVSRILEIAAAAPGREALAWPGGRLDYGRLAAKVRSAAALLAERGVRAGERVVLAAPSRGPEFALGYLACHWLGAVAVPVEPRLGSSTLRAILERTRPRLALLEGAAPSGVESAALGELSRADGGGPDPSLAGPDEPADILFTGGTTGAPKGVVQTARGIWAFARARNAAVGAGADDRLALPLPLSHGYGLGRLRATLLAGGALILIDGFRAAGEVLRALDELGATSLCCVPAGFAVLFQTGGDELGAFDGLLSYVESATAPLTDAQKRRLMSLLPRARLFNSYGMTETTSSIAFIDLNREAGKLGSVGRPVPGVELRIVDAQGRETPRGTAGRVLVRGDGVMKGYWGDEALTREAFVDGWYASNDVGLIDGDGYLFLKGRVADLINVGGLKVAPPEVEEALRAHPAVADCACVAMPDPRGLSGEAVKAFLVLRPERRERPGAEELVEFLRGKLEDYKLPAEFAWVESIPRTPLGKISRAALAAPAARDADESAVIALLERVRRTDS